LIGDLTAQGAGLDVASATEIKTALECGVTPADIVYSNSIKEDKDIIFAAKNNI